MRWRSSIREALPPQRARQARPLLPAKNSSVRSCWRRKTRKRPRRRLVTRARKPLLRPRKTQPMKRKKRKVVMKLPAVIQTVAAIAVTAVVIQILPTVTVLPSLPRLLQLNPPRRRVRPRKNPQKLSPKRSQKDPTMTMTISLWRKLVNPNKSMPTLRQRSIKTEIVFATRRNAKTCTRFVLLPPSVNLNTTSGFTTTRSSTRHVNKCSRNNLCLFSWLVL
mmetsp:Transcript_19052/g.32922  ORF Transcript_19052/g.32922 Transcript_19052/m.32922 type:complete len:221 (-) Transcript_19052:56-718(-)